MAVATHHHASPLGNWTHSTWRPPHLAPFVAMLWYSEGTLLESRERVFPNGLVELVVHLGEPYRLVEGAGGFGPACLSGLQARPIVIEGPRYHRVLGMRLRPAGARALLARPMSELTDLSIDLGAAIGRMAQELVQRCADTTAAEDCFTVGATWLAERLARSRGLDEGVAWAASEIERSGGAASIAALRDELGVSKARLVAAFRDQIGVAPKLYARIIRFRRLLSLLHAGPESLAEAAVAAGYYDQSHMNAEFRELAGITPSAFLAARYPEGDGATAVERG